MSTPTVSASVVYVTCPDDSTTAKKLARGLLENKLIACANIVPKITSMYWWQDAIEEDTEVLLMMKTLDARVPQLTEYVREHHPYEVPEVIAVKIHDGSPAYLNWIHDNVKQSAA
ncbi:hypothetical protein THASP1DRAFT_28768 [Thamnocephalis sphaerospora]|uniref:CutA1 divalent ion tolerance protein n=1 Tax=Thamnocephalis sphaerospora TaxID=78915 RepID=A0A4P9XTI1_9FUNG|nr:hypothetical protein THASP1DRAFT_28768 [Thamnocephalis sphaerospora]|eukprot:RKP09456.1 hypothetical protein THASP1DRAFT_28768 [Thamnocephalis sphaerospora]